MMPPLRNSGRILIFQMLIMFQTTRQIRLDSVVASVTAAASAVPTEATEATDLGCRSQTQVSSGAPPIWACRAMAAGEAVIKEAVAAGAIAAEVMVVEEVAEVSLAEHSLDLDW